MRRFGLVTIFFCFVSVVQAQEKIVPDSLSTARPQIELNSLSPEKTLILDPALPVNDEVFQPDLSLFHQPLFPGNSQTFDFKKYFSNSGLKTESFRTNGYFWSPFLQNGMTFNQASYQLNKRFSFGGNSFGAQSIFDAPKLNPNIQNMSVKGASMYMQYKVSDHFKIETRVSVSSHSSPWEP